jgi:hypothetical protein
MADHLIPEDVKQFIIDKIDSVAELEGLLLLRGNPETEWDAGELARRLYTDEQQTAGILEHLYSLGFLTVKEGKTSGFHYQPNSPKLAEIADRVAEAYSNYLIPVTNLIHSKPETKVQQFADAFKFRNKEDK